jgi:hypothetical protein
MAQTNLGTGHGGPGAGIVDKRRVPTGASSNASAVGTTFFNATKDISTMDAQLITLNAAYYTQARLDGMTKNDKLYALRAGYESGGI